MASSQRSDRNVVITVAITGSARRDLLRSALVGIVAVAAAMTAMGVLDSEWLRLSAFYIPKALAIFMLGAALVLRGLPRHHPFTGIGPANAVTIVRGALIALLAGLLGERADTGAPTLAVGLALGVTILDGVDGWLARRTSMASGFGARFDMETDAVLVAVLAALTWQYGKAGIWVLLSGAMRYLYAAAAVAIPLLRHPVPSTYRGKSIAVVQMMALIFAIAPFCPISVSRVVTAVALAVLAGSFLLDVFWLLKNGGDITGPDHQRLRAAR